MRDETFDFRKIVPKKVVNTGGGYLRLRGISSQDFTIIFWSRRVPSGHHTRWGWFPAQQDIIAKANHLSSVFMSVLYHLPN